MNNTFSIKRFGMILRWNLLTNWRHYLNTTIGMAIGLIMIVFTSTGDATRMKEMGIERGLTDTDMIVWQLGYPLTFTAFIFCFVLAAYIFANMGTKLQRETFMMLPGSNAEKYLCRLLFATVGAAVQFALAVMVADAIQALYALFMHPDFQPSLTLAAFKSISQNPLISITWGNSKYADIVAYTVSSASVLLFSSSFAVLGGTLFRKQPAVITGSIWLALIIGFGYTMGHMAMAGMLDHIPSLSINDLQLIVIATSTILTVIAAINYWLSYRIFCRMQVVCNKWINL